MRSWIKSFSLSDNPMLLISLHHWAASSQNLPKPKNTVNRVQSLFYLSWVCGPQSWPLSRQKAADLIDKLSHKQTLFMFSEHLWQLWAVRASGLATSVPWTRQHEESVRAQNQLCSGEGFSAPLENRSSAFKPPLLRFYIISLVLPSFCQTCYSPCAGQLVFLQERLWQN